MMNYFRKTAAPWFREYGRTLTDVQSYRIVLRSLQAEIESTRKLLPEFLKSPVPSDHVEAVIDIADAEDLASQIEKRIALLLAEKAT